MPDVASKDILDLRRPRPDDADRFGRWLAAGIRPVRRGTTATWDPDGVGSAEVFADAVLVAGRADLAAVLVRHRVVPATKRRADGPSWPRLFMHAAVRGRGIRVADATVAAVVPALAGLGVAPADGLKAAVGHALPRTAAAWIDLGTIPDADIVADAILIDGMEPVLAAAPASAWPTAWRLAHGVNRAPPAMADAICRLAPVEGLPVLQWAACGKSSGDATRLIAVLEGRGPCPDPSDPPPVPRRATLTPGQFLLFDGEPAIVRALLVARDPELTARLLRRTPPEHLPAGCRNVMFGAVGMDQPADPRVAILLGLWAYGRMPEPIPDPGPHAGWFAAFAAAHMDSPWAMRLLARVGAP